MSRQRSPQPPLNRNSLESLSPASYPLRILFPEMLGPNAHFSVSPSSYQSASDALSSKSTAIYDNCLTTLHKWMPISDCRFQVLCCVCRIWSIAAILGFSSNWWKKSQHLDSEAPIIWLMLSPHPGECLNQLFTPDFFFASCCVPLKWDRRLWATAGKEAGKIARPLCTGEEAPSFSLLRDYSVTSKRQQTRWSMREFCVNTWDKGIQECGTCVEIAEVRIRIDKTSPIHETSLWDVFSWVVFKQEANIINMANIQVLNLKFLPRIWIPDLFLWTIVMGIVLKAESHMSHKNIFKIRYFPFEISVSFWLNIFIKKNFGMKLFRENCTLPPFLFLHQITYGLN